MSDAYLTVALDDVLVLRTAGFWGEDESNIRATEPVQVVRAGDISPDGRLLGFASRWFKPRETERAVCKPGDVLITASGNGLGKCLLVRTGDGLASSNFTRRLVPDPDVLHGEYLYLAIQSKVGARKLVEHTATSAFPNLKPTFFVDPWVPLPPLDVQRRIVDLIKHVDMHLANLKDETQAARSMLIRVGGQSDGMPSNPLGSRVRARGGKRMPKGVPFAEGPTSHPYLRIVDLVDGTIRSDGLEYVPDEVFPTIRRYTVRPNEVVISIVGTIGRVAVVPDWADGANLTENAAVVDVLGDQLNAEWLTYWLMSDPGQREIKRVTVGTSQGKLALSRIPLIEVPSLGLERQAELAGVATALQMVVRSLDQEAEAVSALRASLLHRLLDGTIQLPDAYAPLPVGLE